MSGTLHKGYRSGNLAEDLGLLLLKGFAAVGPVPRTEDIGLDAAVATLLREHAGKYYAEDTFVVQLKSASKKTLEYNAHGLRWFLAQSQPMFIGLVSRRDAKISLYPTLCVNQAALALGPLEQVTIRFGNPKKSEGWPWASGPANSATVWLGLPLLEWTYAEMFGPIWFPTTYAILKKFLAVARQERVLLSFGTCSEVVWSTNNEGSIKVEKLRLMKGHADDLPVVAQECMPGFEALLFRAMGISEGRGSSLVRHLCRVIEDDLPALGVPVAESTRVVVKAAKLKSSFSRHR